MKAMAQASWAQGELMQMTELPDPVPRPEEIRVRVKASGVNPVDWKMRSQGPLRLAARLIGPPPPVVVGIDFAGVVDAVGNDISRIRVGDRVVGGTDFSRGQRGSYADTVVVRPDQVAVLPKGFDLEIAGALPVAGVTAYMCVVETVALGPGDKALILGASGGVGQIAVQLAKGQGALVVGVCSGKNAELVRSLGADVVIDYTEGDPLDQAQKHGPFKVILDGVGEASGPRCRALLAPGGRHQMIATVTVLGTLNVLVPPFSSKSVLGRSTTARLGAMVDYVHSGKVKIRIAERLPLAEAERALAMSQEGRLTGKIVLIP